MTIERFFKTTGFFVAIILLLSSPTSFVMGQSVSASEHPLIEAAGRGDLELIKTLLDKGVDVNGKNRTGGTPLTAAVANGQLDVARLLIETGADVNARDHFGRTALMEAAHIGRLELVALLIEKGADVNAKGHTSGERDMALHNHREAEHLMSVPGSTTALMEAAWRNNVDIIKLLIDNGANVESKDEYGRTAFRNAISAKNIEIAELLLKRGANVNSKNRAGETALLEAVGHIEIVKFLLDKGIDLPSPTILMRVVYSRDLETLELLLDKGANPNAKYPNGRTLLMEAAAADHHLTPWYKKLGDLSLRIIFMNPFAPVYRSGERDPQIVKLLLQKGADVNAKDQDGWTALKRAQERGAKEIVEMLKAHGAKE
jgi:ankyrin repeat protein